MYLDIERHNGLDAAAIDDAGGRVSYGELKEFARAFREAAGGRTLIFILCENRTGSVAGYYAAMENHIVPLLLGARINHELLKGLISIYKPKYLWVPEEHVEDICRLLQEISEKASDSKPCIVMNKYGNALISTGYPNYEMYSELSLLLPTSGSTGSSKLVRHSYRNLEANARNISAFFGLTRQERPMVDLPMQYTYGLSVINSHLYAGATLLLSSLSLMRSEYWDFFIGENATSFTGVPYSYEILKKLRFFRMELPSLRTLSQGGGKLSEEMHKEFAQFAKNTGRRFIVTYGQTEGSARMAYLPEEYALEKIGSIGKAIPEGELYIVESDKDGAEAERQELASGAQGSTAEVQGLTEAQELTSGVQGSTAEVQELASGAQGNTAEVQEVTSGTQGLAERQELASGAQGSTAEVQGLTEAQGSTTEGRQEATGEMAYRGPNVTLGYATCAEDLRKGDERGGYLLTGDLARRDADGFYYILGRKSRFLKLQGCRVGLDECEMLIKKKFGVECACTGVDDKMTVHVVLSDTENASDMSSSDDIGCQQATEKQAAEIRRFLLASTGLQGSMFRVRFTDEIPRNPAGKILYAKLQEEEGT